MHRLTHLRILIGRRTELLYVCVQATRLCEELHQEQDRSSHLEKVKKNYEQSIRDLTVKLEEAEQQALKAGKRTIQKLETKVCGWSDSDEKKPMTE